MPEASPTSTNGTCHLNIPREIRDKIYRHLVVAKYVKRKVANHSYDPLSPHMMRNRSQGPDPVEAGELRSQNRCIHTSEFDLTIMCTNHQIHVEVSAIFEPENYWVGIQTNRKGFGQPLKDRGYGVIYYGDPKFLEKSWILGSNFFFEGAGLSEDVFVVTISGHDQLPSVLWITGDIEDAMLYINSRSAGAEGPPFGFYWQPRGIGQVELGLNCHQNTK